MFDLHIHTNFSPDAHDSLQDIVEFSEENKMKTIGSQIIMTWIFLINTH